MNLLTNNDNFIQLSLLTKVFIRSAKLTKDRNFLFVVRSVYLSQRGFYFCQTDFGASRSLERKKNVQMHIHSENFRNEYAGGSEKKGN